MVTTARARPNTPRAKAATPKQRAKPNASILSFFKKVEVEETLFVGAVPGAAAPVLNGLDFVDDDIYEADDGPDVARFNEVESPIKRRKMSPNSDGYSGSFGDSGAAGVDESMAPEMVKPVTLLPTRRHGPFMFDSDSEDDGEEADKAPEESNGKEEEVNQPQLPPTEEPVAVKDPDLIKRPDTPSAHEPASDLPTFGHQDSVEMQFANEAFGDVADFDDEELGEEYREMRFMQEQARILAEEAGDYSPDDFPDMAPPDDAMVESCPICNGSLAGVSPDEATRHVNGCLDGNPIPLPNLTKPEPQETVVVEAPEVSKRFAKAAVPRPGQANPFGLDAGASTSSKSAFTKLMSGHAEDAAWATAAATEHASRGKPAYQRTCPFYKIMPGFSICVDAFRYGKVEGCSAYFLSHFHSDHYVGLTASWSHGPIYCSRVTGALVKAQLGTAARFVKELEFEQTVAVPGTDGVTVTMIPANHCPGSSLFLFEKTLSRGGGANARKQRILHCGDFRACPAHVAHPLLRPELVDAVSGRTRQQKIDICYLDTTYLNPRYSFPPQEDVIRACADLCAELAADAGSADDLWDKMGREAGNGSVSKFFAAGKADGEAGSDAENGQLKSNSKEKRLLVVCGTYSIGKERICKAIAQALGSKIYAPPHKIKICSLLGDAELTGLMTSDPRAAQVHMQMLMEIRAETLQDYLDSYAGHFGRIVGFRPSGWNYRPAGASKLLNAQTQPHVVPTAQLLHGKAWRSRFAKGDFVAQRGSTRTAMCFGVPYSEHSSFRELALFCMGLRIEKVVPTVNVGSEAARKRMKAWTDRWLAERRRGGLLVPLEGREEEEEDGEGKGRLWEGKDGRGGGAWW